jgi:tRNA(Ile)-lysidine synthase
MGPDPAVAAVRLAVRRTLPVLAAGEDAGAPEVRRDATVLVACSGGADSLALLAATVFELRRSPVLVVGAVVDHGLQEGSAGHTARVVAQMAAIGCDETASIRVTVDAGPRGTEAGARQARYVALAQLAQHFRAGRVLLGHTMDDQAETVLLGLTQGSGGRSLSGMRRAFHADEGPAGPLGPQFVRPLLEVTRAQTEAACRAEGIDWWDDPHNTDPRFVRSRVRHTVMPVLERELGPGIAAALARTGHLVREDLDALDDLAEQESARRDLAAGESVRDLEGMPAAVRKRLLRLAALRAGCPQRELTHGHVTALEEMVWERRGEPRDLDLPGHVRAVRRHDVLRLVPAGGGAAGPVAG